MKKVTIKLPLTRAEKDDVYVGINGHSYLIKRGENVQVDENIAKILERREKMLSAAVEFETKASKMLDAM